MPITLPPARLLLVAHLFMLASLAVTTGTTTAQPAPPRLDPTELDTYLEQAVETTKIPGLVALVVDRDRIVYQAAFGQRHVAANETMTTDTIFNLASMTKPVAVTAIMMLVEEGRLALDDPISSYVPEFTGREVIERIDASDSYTTRPATREVTLRHLLSHSSGLAYGFASDTVFRLTGAFGSASDLPLLYDPGDGWSYAGGIDIVAKVLERIEGRGLDAFLRDRLFGPLGMRDTSYIVPIAKHPRVVTVHRSRDGVLMEDPRPADIRSAVSGDGGLYGTASDYSRFIQLFLNEGVAPDGTRLLSRHAIREMTTNQLGTVVVSTQDEPMPDTARSFPLGAGRDGFGLGFQVTGAHELPYVRRPGSSSWAGLYNTEFWIDPATGLGAVLLMQYLPFYDIDALDTLVGFERRVYGGR